MLLASMHNEDAYRRVARIYAESKFRSDSPMYTTAMLFSGIEAESSRRIREAGVKADELRGNWKRHLASIINNRTFGWEKTVLSLGDRLSEAGCIKEAHFCYMVCGYPITSPTDVETRVALLGCDHSEPKNRALLTSESLVAYERTEAYEWAKRLGNQDAYFITFQPFKLMYAMLLADDGQNVQAQKILQSIQISPDEARTASSQIQEVSVDQIFSNDVAFELAYNEVENQLQNIGTKTNYSQSLLNGGLLDISASTKAGPTKMFKQPNEEHESITSTPKNPSLDATFMTAKSNLMDVSGYTLDESKPTKEATMRENKKVSPYSKSIQVPAKAIPKAGEKNLPEKSEPKTVSNNKKTPYKPQFDGTPAVNEKKMEKQQRTPTDPASQRETPKAAPATAPPVMQGKKDESEKAKTPKKAPASTGKPKKAPGSGAFSGMKSWLIKKLNPDAKECHLPENEEQPYYDEKIKRE